MSDQVNLDEEGVKLIDCPACHKTVSNQAVACPHCGHPLKERQKKVADEQNGMPAKQGIGFWGVFFAIILAIVVMSLV